MVLVLVLHDVCDAYWPAHPRHISFNILYLHDYSRHIHQVCLITAQRLSLIEFCNGKTRWSLNRVTFPRLRQVPRIHPHTRLLALLAIIKSFKDEYRRIEAKVDRLFLILYLVSLRIERHLFVDAFTPCRSHHISHPSTSHRSSIFFHTTKHRL